MDISGQITAGADSLILSHWQRPDATAGIAWPGRWADKTSRSHSRFGEIEKRDLGQKKRGGYNQGK